MLKAAAISLALGNSDLRNVNFQFTSATESFNFPSIQVVTSGLKGIPHRITANTAEIAIYSDLRLPHLKSNHLSEAIEIASPPTSKTIASKNPWKVAAGIFSSLFTIAGSIAMIKHIRLGNLNDKTLASFTPWTINAVISFVCSLGLRDPYISIPAAGVALGCISYFSVACKHLKFGKMQKSEVYFMTAACAAAGLYGLSRSPTVAHSVLDLFNISLSSAQLNEYSFALSMAAAVIGAAPTINRMIRANPKGTITSSLLFYAAPWAGFMLGRLFGLFSIENIDIKNVLFVSSIAILAMNTTLTVGAIRCWLMDAKAKRANILNKNHIEN